MEQNAIRLFQSILEKNGIPFSRLKKGQKQSFDGNLRGMLFGQEQYAAVIERMIAMSEEKTICYWVDCFQCCHYVLKKPDSDGCYLVGPFLRENTTENSWDLYGRQLGIPVSKQELYVESFQQLNTVSDVLFLYNAVYAFMEMLYGAKCAFSYKEVIDREEIKQTFSDSSYENVENIEMIEQRYALMQSILKEVSSGNKNEALASLAKFQSISRNPRLMNLAKDTQNWLVTYNTSLRNTVEQSGIHPYYIHVISTKFSYLLENAKTPSDKEKMMIEMTKEYCDLVKEQSGKQYSSLIQQVILYIRMNLSEDIGLASISKKYNVNSTYLSKKFHDEVGMSMTEYRNQLRIEESLEYLKKTDLPVKDIIYKVGIYDVNYYMRLFKRYMHMTPRAYRKKESSNMVE